MSSAASVFITLAIQDWGFSAEQRIEAVQGVLNEAGFTKAKATCYPVFGGIWPKPCEGEQGEEATKWLQNLTNTMKRGHIEDEIEHVRKAIANRKFIAPSLPASAA